MIAFYSKKERAALAEEVSFASGQYALSGNSAKADRLSRHFEYINSFMELKNETPSAKISGNVELIPHFLSLLYSGKKPPAFWEYFRSKYSLPLRVSPDVFWDYFDEFQPRRMEISGWLELNAKGKTLDIGSGSHSYVPVHTACDISGKALAKNKFARHKKRVNPNAERLPFASSSFDTIMLNSVLAYVSNWRQLFSEYRRILRQNGVLLITNAPINGYHPAKYFEVNEVDANRLMRILSSYGFAVNDESEENKILVIGRK